MPTPDDFETPPRPDELDDLPRRVEPPDLLEERVVHALRHRGILRVDGRGDPPRRRTGRSRAPAWSLAAAAVGLALFVGGYALGQRHGAEAAADLVASLQQADARERAALVQRTGSLWVTAITALADAGVASGDPAVVEPGREAALAGLRAAALELARLGPGDVRLARVLDALGGPPVAAGSPDRTILWF